jgi:hypothetical protein
MEENLLNSFFVGEVEIEPGKYRFGCLDALFQSPSGRPFQFGMKGIGGGYYGGWQLGSEISSSWTLSPHLTVNIEYIYSFIKIKEETYRPHVVRMRIRSALNKSLSANAFIQYNSDIRQLASNIRLHYNPSEGVDVYIVYKEGISISHENRAYALPRTSVRSILIKFNYTFIL